MVIGGGVIGLTTSLELKRRGLSVTLLEKTHPGDGASSAAGGILSPLRPWQSDDDLTKLCTLSLSCYKTLLGHLHQHGFPVKQTTSGSLYLMPDEASTAANWARSHGWEFKPLDTDTLAREEPAIEADTGFLFPQVGWLDPRMLLNALVSTATRLGVTIRTNCAVRSIAIKRHHAVGIKTDRGTITADRVVVCAGAWMTSLLPVAYIRPKVRPVRGQMIEYAPAPSLLRHIVLCKQAHSLMDYYLIPHTNGHILVGSTFEYCDFDTTVTNVARNALSKFATRTLPALIKSPIVRHWAGLRPDAQRSNPIICAHPEIDNLFLNGGHFRNGILLAPASALLLAQLVCNVPTTIDATPFAIDATKSD